MLKISIGSDHGGFEYKQIIIKHLQELEYQVFDCGTDSLESCHYPLYGEKAARMVSNKEVDFGILVCTTGEGIMMAANKIKGVRCGIGYNDEVSCLMREHNDANMISFGQAHMSIEDVLKRIDIFLTTPFLGERHLTRVEMINKLD